MPSPRCSFNVNGALGFVPSTWKPEGACTCRFEGTELDGPGAATAGRGCVVVGALGLLLADPLGLGEVVGSDLATGLDLAAGLDLATGSAFGDDRDLLRLTVPALDFAIALLFLFFLLLVLAAALAFKDFAFFLATMRPPFAQ